MPAGPYEGQVPVREYEEDRDLEGRMQLIGIPAGPLGDGLSSDLSGMTLAMLLNSPG
jgi:hypothetical protein